MKQFNDPWGFSKLDTYRACHRKFFYQFVQKIEQPGSEAMDRGQKIHEDIEMYLNGWQSTLSPDTENWREALDLIKTKNFKAEQAIGLTKDWTPLKNWFGKEVWLRAKIDAIYIDLDVLYVIDFKSGKFRKPSLEQVELYAIVGSALYPELKKVVVEYWFIDTGEIYKDEYTKDTLIKLRKKYEEAVAPIYLDTTWEENPSRECRWCSYSKTKGGPCKY